MDKRDVPVIAPHSRDELLSTYVNFRYALLPREFFPCSPYGDVLRIEWLAKLDFLPGRNSPGQWH